MMEEEVEVFFSVGKELPPGGPLSAVSRLYDASDVQNCRSLFQTLRISEDSDVFALKHHHVYSWKKIKAKDIPPPMIEGQIHIFQVAADGPAASVDVVDLTGELLHEFATPVVPQLQDLRAFLHSKPEGLAIPIRPVTYNLVVRAHDRLKMFTPSTSEAYSLDVDRYLYGLLSDTGKSEFSFIPLWDHFLHLPVTLFCVRAVSKDRNTNFNTGTLNLLPDYVGYIGSHYSLWIGEEKPPDDGNPREELINKREWCYKTLPYVLAYYARGFIVTIVALYLEDGRLQCKDMESFNLSNPSHRIFLFSMMFNVSRVLAGLHDMCVEEQEDTELEVVQTIGTGKSVRLVGKEVVKGYQTAKKRKQVWDIYQQLGGCPNLEKCLSRKPCSEELEGDSRKRAKLSEYTLRFSRLNRKARARTQEALVAALLHVSRALVWFKNNGWMHRDVHWRNVAFSEATKLWTLIDNDEACRVDSQEAAEARRLCPQVHAPEMLVGAHTPAVDVWGVGYLIASAPSVDASNQEVEAALDELAERCMAMDPTKRPEISEIERSLLEFSDKNCESLGEVDREKSKTL